LAGAIIVYDRRKILSIWSFENSRVADADTFTVFSDWLLKV
jgi:hypothetical protein